MTSTILAPRAKVRAQSLTPNEQLSAAREIVRLEAVALWRVSNRLGGSLLEAIDVIRRGRGCVIVTGMGKAGLIGQKIAATLASTGTRSHFVHPAEAYHGDLGRIHEEDVVLVLSQSGETDEVVQLLPCLRDIGVPIIALTANRVSTVGRAASTVIELGHLEEACSLGLAPSTSTTAMLAVGDALALVLSKMNGFGAEDFARFHPGGALGRKLSRVDDHMRPLSHCRVALELHSVREVLVQCSKPGRRTGAIMLVDDEGKLTGLFTDSDLARLFERREEASLDRPMRVTMIRQPRTIDSGARIADAVELMAQCKISELPVVSNDGKPLGLIDVTDIVGLSVDNASDSPSESVGVRMYSRAG